MALILFGVFFFLVFCNIPIAVALGASSIVGLLLADFPLEMFPDIMCASISKFALLAIPYFILSGILMEHAGISRRLIAFASACVGHTRSGLVVVVVAVSCFFAAISGSGPATVAALGSILVPAMVAAGYDGAVATALMSSSGAIGIIIPPSVGFIVFASITDVSVGKLFAGGLLPGLLLGGAFVLAAMWASRNNPRIQPLAKVSRPEFWRAFKSAFWGMMMPVIILGGIYSGIFTPTEAAGVSIVYGLFVGVFIHREIQLRDLGRLFLESAVVSATVMYIIACASVFAWLLTASNTATNISAALMSLSSNKYVLLVIINFIFLVAGCFLDGNSSIYIVVPIVYPIIRELGIDPVHFGVFLIVNVAIGLVTPPVGVNLYVGCNILKLPVSAVCRKLLPFFLAGLATLILVTYIPAISLFLPNFVR
ncbi:MAG: TRAP transporter large permease [Planctomycetes bacterium]|nr:TRAP transporter large permease [Planctomycetota bacterium]